MTTKVPPRSALAALASTAAATAPLALARSAEPDVELFRLETKMIDLRKAAGDRQAAIEDRFSEWVECNAPLKRQDIPGAPTSAAWLAAWMVAAEKDVSLKYELHPAEYSAAAGLAVVASTLHSAASADSRRPETAGGPCRFLLAHLAAGVSWRTYPALALAGRRSGKTGDQSRDKGSRAERAIVQEHDSRSSTSRCRPACDARA
jgi:hypothetical protein